MEIIWFKKGFNIYLTLLIVLFSSIYTYAQYDSIPFDDYNRTYLLRLPSGYDGITQLPLIIAMHGGFGNAYNIENQSQLSIKAEDENFIVVYPEGIEGGAFNISSWNAGWCCGFASSSNIDDVGFIDALLDTLISQHIIDTNRIYATGMSNGGFMAFRLGCELSDRIAAIAPVAASMSMTNCTPTRPVPVINFHSYLDTNIPYLGGQGDGVSNHHNSPQDSVMNVWADVSVCSILNDTITDNEEFTLVKWTSCNCLSEIHYYITQDGGHSWPGGVQTIIGDPVSQYINATDKMWEFFQQHSLDCETNAINDTFNDETDFKIFPNPTLGILNIESIKNRCDFEITIYNQFGEIVLKTKNVII